MAPHRVLFVESYPHSLYGQQETLTALLERCPAAGIEPLVVTPAEGVFVEQLRARGHHVEVWPQPSRLNRYGGALYRDGIGARWRSLTATAGYVRRIRHRLRAIAPAAVYANDMRGLLTVGVAARLGGVPILTWDKLDKPHGVLDHLQLPLVHRNLVISRAVVRKYPRWQRRWYRRRIVRVFNGIELGRYAQPAAPVTPLPAEGDGPILAIVGSVTPRKGHDLLLAAFRRARARVPGLRLWVVGDAVGEEDRRFRDGLRTPTAPDGVRWLGFRDDVPAVLRRIDVLVSPSRHEGMGRVNVEAMAAGKPVIGAAGTGIAEVIVDGETGLLVDPNDEAAFADAIVRLANDPSGRERMGRAGRARAQREFDQDTQLTKVLGELRALIDD